MPSRRSGRQWAETRRRLTSLCRAEACGRILGHVCTLLVEGTEPRTSGDRYADDGRADLGGPPGRLRRARTAAGERGGIQIECATDAATGTSTAASSCRQASAARACGPPAACGRGTARGPHRPARTAHAHVERAGFPSSVATSDGLGRYSIRYNAAQRLSPSTENPTREPCLNESDSKEHGDADQDEPDDTRPVFPTGNPLLSLSNGDFDLRGNQAGDGYYGG